MNESWYQQNKDRIQEERRKKYAKDPTIREKAKKLALEYYYDHKKEISEKRKVTRILKPDYQYLKKEEWKEKLFAILGGKCKKCGFSDKRALQVDHVNGGGTKERKDRGSRCTYVIYREMVKDPNVKKKYQLLCANCNWIKREENGEVRKSRSAK